MHKLEGKLFAPNQAAFVDAEMWRDELGQFWLESAVDPETIVEIQHITPAVGRVPVLITLADGRRFEAIDVLPENFQQTHSSGLRWLEAATPLKVVVLVAVVIGALVGMRAVFPQISDALLLVVPQSADIALGEDVEAAIDGLLFEDTRLTEAEQQQAQELFVPIAQAGLQGLKFEAKLLLRGSEFLGANALAMPHGAIVMTDDLWNLLKDDPAALQAVFAHEIIHVRNRHGMRNLLRYTLMGAVVFLFGLDDSIVEELTLIFTQFAQAGYSREFEREADRGAAQILIAQGIDPAALSRALSLLEFSACGAGGCEAGSWFASHPDFPERRRLIEQAGD